MKKTKLNVLAAHNLSKIEMNQVRGGQCCNCGCQGPSSKDDNAMANYEGNKKATTPVQQWVCSSDIGPIRINN